MQFAKESGSYVTENKSVNLIIYIESAVAIINLPDICKASIELSEKGKFLPVALVFGSDDFLASIGMYYCQAGNRKKKQNIISHVFVGASRTDDSLEVLYARQKLVLVAKAFGLQAIDMVYIQYKGKAINSRYITYSSIKVCFVLKISKDLESKVKMAREWVTQGNR